MSSVSGIFFTGFVFAAFRSLYPRSFSLLLIVLSHGKSSSLQPFSAIRRFLTSPAVRDEYIRVVRNVGSVWTEGSAIAPMSLFRFGRLYSAGLRPGIPESFSLRENTAGSSKRSGNSGKGLHCGIRRRRGGNSGTSYLGKTSRLRIPVNFQRAAGLPVTEPEPGLNPI